MASPVYDERRSAWSVRFRWPRGRDGGQRTFNCENEREARGKAESVEKLIAKLTDKTLPFSIPPNVENQALWIFSGGTKGFKQTSRTERPSTIRELADSFLAARKSQADDGEISVAMYSDDYYQLNNFVAYCKKVKRTKLLQEVVDIRAPRRPPEILQWRKQGHSMARGQGHQALLTWGWKAGKFDNLPRDIDDYAKVARPRPVPKFFTVDEVKEMHAKATPPMKAWILLALNCGFTQVDIATLTHGMIDMEAGTLSQAEIRPRCRKAASCGPQRLRH